MDDKQILTFAYSKNEFKDLIKESVLEIINETESKSLGIENKKPIKIEDVSELLQVGISTVHKWKNKGKIPFCKMENTTYFFHEDIICAISGSKGY